jgi:hypothetical protein
MYYERLQSLFPQGAGTDYNIDGRAYRRLLFDTNNRVWIDRSA